MKLKPADNDRGIMKPKTSTRDISMSNRYRAFRVKFIPPANVRGSRVMIHDLTHDEKKTIEHDGGNAIDIALRYLESIGISIDGMAMGGGNVNNDLLLSLNARTSILTKPRNCTGNTSKDGEHDGYWINKDAGYFRCYNCGLQFFRSEMKRPTPLSRIEVWEGD